MPKSSGQRCPSCGANVTPAQRYCRNCGAPLRPKRTPSTSTNRLSLRKLLVGLFAFLIFVALLGHFAGDNNPDPTPDVALVTAVSAAARPPTVTSEPPTATPAPPILTSTAQPDATTGSPPRTLQPTVAPESTKPPTHLPTSMNASGAQVTATTGFVNPSLQPRTRVPADPTLAISIFDSPTRTQLSSSPTPIPSALAPRSTAPNPPSPTQSGLALAANYCGGYDAWEWAQSVYESDPATFAGLDPDGNGIACDGLEHGFAPAFWTTSLPANAIPATIAYIVDGDTYELIVNGQSARYRLYHADTPEVYPEVECGGNSATAFARYALSFSDTPGQIWIDGIDQRDKYGRKLAYLWFTVDGEPYLLNHVLITNGWAEDIDYGDPYNPYKTQLRAAALFAKKHQLGVWAECGGFGIPLTAPTPPPAPTQAPMGLTSNCNPNYLPCVPDVPYDLDCPDIGFRVQVIGYDEYRFDRDGDGIGCESY